MLLQLGPNLAEVCNGAGEAVEPIDDDLRDLPSLHCLHQLLEGWAVCILAREPPVVKDEGGLTGKTPTVVDLCFYGNAILFFNRLSGIDGIHDGSRSLTGLLCHHTGGLDSGAVGAG